MTDLTPRDQWPQWLQEADTEDARVQVIGGVVYWYGGTWLDGLWRGGTWHGGIWLDGVWRDGDSAIRSSYQPRWDGDIVRIGCKLMTIPEWDAWFAGDEQYETPRNTEAFRLIHAHYQAIRAWVVAMGWHGEAAQ